MALEKYNEKRDFTKTKEPKGVKKASKGDLRFVVQKHAASRLHYDFRLEIDGVLVSWAVPKGPSANPADKRLAMQTEDHPMDYIDFEGTIPKGEYGGGTVMVWDIGTYNAEGNTVKSKDKTILKKMLSDGNIKIELNGEKLKGSWHLIRMKGEDSRQWLLMKHKDEFAGEKIEYNQLSVLTKRDLPEIEKGNHVWHSNRSSENKTDDSTTSNSVFSPTDLKNAKHIKSFPDDWRPQLATLADEPFDNADWIFETKYDGYRALAQIKNGDVTLISRNGNKFSKYKEINEALSDISLDVILDGEIVSEDEKGKSNFQSLQNYEDNPKLGMLKYYVFDIIYFNGFDLRGIDLMLRKKILRAVLPDLPNIKYSDHVEGNGIKAFKKAGKEGGEGIIAKRKTSTYLSGKRTKDWLKIKTEMQQEMLIAGYTDPQGSRSGLGAIICGYHQNDELVYSGKVGTGFNESSLKNLLKQLTPLERKTSPFSDPPKLKGVHWVTPKLIAQVKFSELTKTGIMRHPVFLGLRTDKSPEKVIAEKPEVETGLLHSNGSKKSTEKASKKSPTVDPTDIKSIKSKVEFTNTDKLFWPKEGITKGDVIRYYNDIAEYILPYLIDRPQSLRRTPDGIKSEGFFQKNVAGTVPKWIKTRKIKSDSAKESIEWLLCQDKDTLLFLANYGCIELNPWSSRVGSLNNPDYIIFDLDPNKADMKKLVATALKVKEVLDRLKIKGYVKTSGGKGIHVFIPVLPKYTYEQTRDFSLIISQMVHRELPNITSLERMPAKRVGKIYLDFLQNGRGKTMASIYSIRPREGAGVSTPLDWDEINDNLDLTKFNINTIPQRLQQKGDLWKNFFDDAIDLKDALSNL